MPVTPVLLEPEGEYATIIGFSCLHAGAATHNQKRAAAIREKVQRPDTWVLDLGDDLEMGTRSSVGAGVYEQTMDPESQLEYAQDWWKPVADRMLGVVESNHNNRARKGDGINVTVQLARYLRVPYLGWSNVLRVKVGQNHQRTYTIYCWHGSSGASKPAGKLSCALGMADVVAGCDVYLMGHLHDALTYDRVIETPGLRHLIRKQQWFCVAGSCLDRETSYGDEKGYKPADHRMVAIRLYKEEPRIECYKVGSLS